MSAEEAVTYGLIDRVIEERTQELVTPVPATV
jgi:ATP-dependent Clp protease protease subunit